MRHRLWAGLGIALALSTSLATPALAGKVTLVDPAESAAAVVPGSEPGVLRDWVQLVWNPVDRRLDRIAYTAWDPVPSLGLELQWVPDDPAAAGSGAITGKGTLSFRTPGAASYDPSATVAQYRGTLVDGRFEGEGEFVDSAGFAYVGSWRRGLMDGHGRLMQANGDEYVGAFRAGLRDGAGVFTDASGHIYRAGFTAGVPNVETLFAQSEDGLRIGIVAERRPHNYEIGLDPMSYTSRSDGEVLTILPDDQRLLAAWHGTETINLTDDEQRAFDNISTTPSFLGPAERFDPLSLVFEIENATTAAVSLVGGFLEVADSKRNGEPAMQVRPFPRDPCSGIIEFLPRFFIDNFGWVSADNAALNVTAASLDGRSGGSSLSVPLGSISDSVMADTTEQLKSLGLDTDLVATTKLTCTDPNDERLCLAELKQSGHFGQLAEFISLEFSTVTVNIAGTLDYDWTGSDGVTAAKSSPFSVVLPIASVANDAECGEGGEIIPVSHDPFMLRLDESGYRIAIPFAGDVTPGFTSRWRIELQAPETSEHDFALVLLTADGQQIRSRPVHLSYFIPPRHAVLMAAPGE
ncbi:MAG: hypothetical protein J0I48_05565 [Devosia sp.]|uniref:hypothetical protein n=1 Tax=Devosia sp. 66-22 TaxID=1895753 RepID=UPI000B00F021|nr:hypothetical protein [Devosia sp. 66-22]MBN9345662.1 hypothetical protein [Devosia sp.]